MYIAVGQGQTTFVDKILMLTESLVTLPICCKFQKIFLKSDFIHNFHVFIHAYSTGAGADNPLGSEFLNKHKPFVTLVICCKFLSLNDFLTVFPI